MNLADLPLVLTVDELARDVLRADRKTAYQLVHTGAIRSVKLGRAIRIPRAAVAEYLGEDYKTDNEERELPTNGNLNGGSDGET